MARFTMSLDLDVHDHSPTAHRNFVGQMLDQVKQALGDGVSTKGDVVRAPGGAQPARVVGSWQIQG